MQTSFHHCKKSELTKNITYLLVILALYSCSAQSSLSSHKEVLLLMGTRFEVTATAESKLVAEKAVKEGISEIERIENLISSWKTTSQTSEINRNAGIKPVQVDQELYELIERSLRVSRLTDGAFDITFASMEKLYNFDKKEHELPESDVLQSAIAKIDYNKIVLDSEDRSVFLSESGMKIGFGGIGKGYAANRAKRIMQSVKGVAGGVVNASGDLVVWGNNGREEDWSIQISDPKDINTSLGSINIKNASVVTSGDYEKYFTSENRRYAHIIIPSSGLPTTGVKSVTIVCPDAELGDALATSVFVLGATEGMNLINRLKNIEALIITDDDRVFTSKNLEFKKQKL